MRTTMRCEPTSMSPIIVNFGSYSYGLRPFLLLQELASMRARLQQLEDEKKKMEEHTVCCG